MASAMAIEVWCEQQGPAGPRRLASFGTEALAGAYEVRAIAAAVGCAPPTVVRAGTRDVMLLMTEPRALVLGSDLLKSFRRVSLDFRNRKVRFSLRR